MWAVEELAPRACLTQLMDSVSAAILRPIHLLIASPALLFVASLGLMLFRPPDVKLIAFDRVALLLLAFAILIRAFILRQPLLLGGPIVMPLVCLVVLCLAGVLARPYDPEAWGLLAAKWAVPLFLFYFAGQVFDDITSRALLDVFCLLVLAYLCFSAIAFMIGAYSLIFPRYILDEGLGYHADRARGPFLQAVANGVAINLLGLVALDSYRRQRLRGPLAAVFLLAVPFAILATKTRAVWISFAASILLSLCFVKQQRVRRACLALIFGGALCLIAAISFTQATDPNAFADRLAERSPLEFRKVIYQAGWQMLLQKPLTGWGAAPMRRELGKRISDFRQESFFFHNTFLEIAVQYGLIGLCFYLWLVADLFRVGRTNLATLQPAEPAFADAPFRSLWPVLLFVYLFNACFVVMNYQFVNSLLFTFAGLLAAHRRQVL